MQKVKTPRKATLSAGASRMTRKALVQAITAITITSALVPVSSAVRADELEKPGLLHRYTVNIQDLVIKGLEFVGVPYRRGGNTVESGLDCSGFTRHVFENSVGLLLPRRSSEQAQAPGLLSIRQDDLKPGDLVFFNTMRSAFSHVGIYVGEGKFIHAPRTGSTVRVEDMRQDYWLRRFDGARRAPQLSTSATSRSLGAANTGN